VLVRGGSARPAESPGAHALRILFAGPSVRQLNEVHRVMTPKSCVTTNSNVRVKS